MRTQLFAPPAILSRTTLIHCHMCPGFCAVSLLTERAAQRSCCTMSLKICGVRTAKTPPTHPALPVCRYIITEAMDCDLGRILSGDPGTFELLGRFIQRPSPIPFPSLSVCSWHLKRKPAKDALAQGQQLLLPKCSACGWPRWKRYRLTTPTPPPTRLLCVCAQPPM